MDTGLDQNAQIPLNVIERMYRIHTALLKEKSPRWTVIPENYEKHKPVSKPSGVFLLAHY